MTETGCRTVYARMHVCFCFVFAFVAVCFWPKDCVDAASLLPNFDLLAVAYISAKH